MTIEVDACCPGQGSTGEPAPDDLAAGFKALGDPVRVRLYSLIAARDEICVCELTLQFEQSAPTISHHLKVLREAGLVRAQRRGTWVYYASVPDAVARLGAFLTA